MVLHLFIIESANSEEFELIFENGEAVDTKIKEFKVKFQMSNIEETIGILIEKFKDDEINISFIDEQYLIKYYYTIGGNEEFNIIKKYEKFDNINFCCCNWLEYYQKFLGIDIDSKYIFVSSKNFINVYAFANFLQIPLSSNCFFSYGIKKFEDIIDCSSYYNIFSPIPKSEQFDILGYEPIIDTEAIDWIIEYGTSQLKEMEKAGIREKEKFIQNNVQTWSLNMASYFSKGILIEYDLIPKQPETATPEILGGNLYQELFNESADFRFQIYQGMSSVIRKFNKEFK